MGGGEIEDVEFWRYRLAYSDSESGVGGGEIDDVEALMFEVSNEFPWSSVLLPEESKIALLSRGAAGSVAGDGCPVGILSLVGFPMNNLPPLPLLQGVAVFMLRLGWS